MWKTICAADMQTICRDCGSRIGVVPKVPVWVANSLGLKFNRVSPYTYFNFFIESIADFMQLMFYTAIKICKMHVIYF
jgi:DNA-directed RNA polymerase subunit RPC12/RpoP